MYSQSQQTQFTNGQRDTRATAEDLLESRKKFLNSLITRNNSNNEDPGVNKVLVLLDKDNFPKACKGNKIKEVSTISRQKSNHGIVPQVKLDVASND